MARPRRSTIDEFIDTFADWDCDTQERVMDQLELVQRLAKRRAAKPKTEETDKASDQVSQSGNKVVQIEFQGVTA